VPTVSARPGHAVSAKLDRLARSTFHLTQIAESLKEQGIGLKVLDQAIDTTTPTGKLLFDVLAAISEFETAIRNERQIEGIEQAKKRGVQFGRQPKVTKEQIEEMRRKREVVLHRWTVWQPS
jgi:DNA invertase Pin-like site-specific DNA recombinase